MPSETRTCRRAGESMRAWYGTGSAGRQIGRAQRAPLSDDLTLSGTPGDRQSTRPRVLQALARPEPRGRREANGQGHARARRGPRRPMTARLSLIGRSSPLLADNVRRRPPARPLASAPGGRLTDHPCEGAFWHASDGCRMATPPRTPTLLGTGGESASSSRGSVRRAKRAEQPAMRERPKGLRDARSAARSAARPSSKLACSLACPCEQRCATGGEQPCATPAARQMTSSCATKVAQAARQRARRLRDASRLRDGCRAGLHRSVSQIELS